MLSSSSLSSSSDVGRSVRSITLRTGAGTCVGTLGAGVSIASVKGCWRGIVGG
jgi:hypothetical protein